MPKLGSLFQVLTVIVSTLAIANPLWACGSFRVLTEDGHNFFVFNFELGGPRDLIETRVVYYPVGTELTGSAPDER